MLVPFLVGMIVGILLTVLVAALPLAVAFLFLRGIIKAMYRHLQEVA